MKNKVPKQKIETVKEISELIKKNRTILIASIANLPTSQIQKIQKKLRGKAVIKVLKKNLIFLAIDSLKDEKLEKLKEQIKRDFAILFSNLESFELSNELEEIKIPSKAKKGQESPKDIEIPAGPTDLTPGPAISELGSLGIKIKIEKGKISIQEPKIIVKKGEEISQLASDLMSKLGIKPFLIGLTPLASFDTQEKRLYLNIKINKSEKLKELKEAYLNAIKLSIAIVYYTKENINRLIKKAYLNAETLKSLENKK